MTSFATAPTQRLAKSAPRFGLKGVVAAAFASILNADQRYRDRRRLEETPDHLLDDMGLTRSDLHRALEHGSR